jgi:hypothetical protein
MILPEKQNTRQFRKIGFSMTRENAYMGITGGFFSM